MGMWEGIYLGMQNIRERREREAEREEARRIREEDMAFRREQFERGILEQRRTTMLQMLAERRQLNREVQQQINGAVAMGLQRPAADALYRSGQLGLVVESLQEQELSRNQIEALSEEVIRQLGDRASDDQVAGALAGVATSGANLADPREAELALTESILNATGVEELQGMYGDVLDVGVGRTSMEPFDISITTANVDLEEERRIRNSVIQRLQSQFGPNTFEVTQSGDYEFAPNAPADVVNLVTQISDRAVDLVRTPGEGQVDAVTAVRSLTSPIIAARGQGAIEVSTINQNLPLLFEQGPEAFLETITAPTAPPPVEPIVVPGANPVGDAMEAMTEMQGSRGSRAERRDRAGSVAPTQSGFGFDIQEELDR